MIIIFFSKVGKTGAYLHFARLLHRMLIKLQKVDVYDEIPLTQGPDTKETTSKSITPPSPYPDYKTICQMPFSCELKGHQYAKTSPLMLYNAKKEPTVSKVTTKTKTTPVSKVTSVLLSSWAAHDICHHCDSCKTYRDGVSSSTSLYYIYQLDCGENLHFLIPPTYISEFSYNDSKQLKSLKLPRVLVKGTAGEVVALKNEGEKIVTRSILSPIMISSTGRHDTGRRLETTFRLNVNLVFVLFNPSRVVCVKIHTLDLGFQ